MATSSDATTASDTDPYAYTYADRPGEYYAPYTVLFANTAADLVPEHWVARYEREAAKNWDKFYLRHGSTFFATATTWARSGLSWTALAAPRRPPPTPLRPPPPTTPTATAASSSGALRRPTASSCLEAGCAVGNTLFPLLSKLPKLSAFGVDYSEVAVGLCREDPRYAALHAAGRISVATGDLTVAMPAELAERARASPPSSSCCRR